MNKNHKYWTITIKTWGTLYGIGTEEEANEWGEAKGDWEGFGYKLRESTDKEIKEKQFDIIKDLLPKSKCTCPSDESHLCPFKKEINDDYETECNCCDDCTYECSMGI